MAQIEVEDLMEFKVELVEPWSAGHRQSLLLNKREDLGNPCSTTKPTLKHHMIW